MLSLRIGLLGRKHFTLGWRATWPVSRPQLPPDSTRANECRRVSKARFHAVLWFIALKVPVIEFDSLENSPL
jgi:hypothetical protein